MQSVKVVMKKAMLSFAIMVVTGTVFSQPAGTNISNLHVKDTGTITLYKTWNIFFNKPSSYQVPMLYTLSGTDTVPVSSSAASWTSADAGIASVNNNVLTANSSGRTMITASLDGQSVSIPLQVNTEIRPVEHEPAIDPFLTQPATGYKALVPVLVICYLPTPDGVTVNTTEAGFAPIPDQTIDNLKSHILKIFRHTKHSLEEGSKFRGYKNPQAIPYLGYKVVDYIYVYEPVPRGFNNPAGTSYFSDYNNIVNRFNGKKYVDTLGVKEIWLMGYDHGEIVPAESNMSSPTTGDISNSYRFPDDLPVYSKTYILYNYNFTRQGNEATHDHGHQIEAMVDYVAIKQDGNTSLFMNSFRGYGQYPQPMGRCGDTHHPPNTSIDYDYYNYNFAASDIMDWKPEGGQQTQVNANTWGNINYNWPAGTTPDIESNWYVFWMQSLPGYGNQIPYNTKWMTNWWQFLSNWDSATAKTGLYQDNVALPLTLGSFIAFNKGAVNELQWQMSLNESLSLTEIERSADGVHYVLINQVAASGSTADQQYAYTDAKPFQGRNYYRLKLVDKSGKFSYSTVAMANVQGTLSARVAPNPAKDMISVSGLSAGTQSLLQLTNVAGEVVLSVKAIGEKTMVNISYLPKGEYILKISSNGQTIAQKVMKQ